MWNGASFPITQRRIEVAASEGEYLSISFCHFVWKGFTWSSLLTSAGAGRGISGNFQDLQNNEMSETERTTGDQAHLQLPNPWLKATYQTIWWFLSQPQFAGWVQSDPHTEQKLVVKNLNASETKGFPQGTGSITLYFPKQTCCQVSFQAHPCVGVAWATAEDKMWTSPSQWNGSRNPPNLFVIRSLIVCTYTHHTSATALLHIFSMSGTAGRTSFAVASTCSKSCS